jgi:hypothetical protein
MGDVKGMKEFLFKHGRLRTSLALAVGFILLSTIVPIAGNLEAEDGARVATAYDRYAAFQEMRQDLDAQGRGGSPSVSGGNHFSYESGPYPMANADGSLPGFNSVPLLELMDNPPYFIGWELEATGASDYYVVGYGHESYFGDLNNDGSLTWVVFYFDMGLSVNGVDDDGDGCIDETTNTTSDGQLCDTVPDAVVFFGVGGLPSIDGDLIAYVDMYFDQMIKLFRIGVSPRWVGGGGVRVLSDYYVEVVGEFVTFYGSEASVGINVNKAIGDKDLSDTYVGIIDARKFPAKPPKNHFCRTGRPIYHGYAYERQDGSVVVTFEMWEGWDEAPGYDNDYNDDGDTSDEVMGYFVVNPRSGRCKEFVNTGVHGTYPRVAGNVITSGRVFESNDARDWNNDGDTYDTVFVWHDVTSTEALAGNPYFSYTFSALVPRGPAGRLSSYGFGFTGLYSAAFGFQTFPLEFGGAYDMDTGYPDYYKTYYWHILDEDGWQWTELPKYLVEVGQPFDNPGGICISVLGGVDFDGDGWPESAAAVYCPDPNVPGTGRWEVEPASNDPPWLYFGYVYYCTSGGKNLITMPYFDIREWAPPGGVTDYWDVSGNWHFNKVDPDFQITDAQWVGAPQVQLGGNISGYIDVENIGETDTLCHARLENDKGWEMRYDGCVENTKRDGILIPGETARIHFTLFAPDKEKAGIYTSNIELTLQRVARIVPLDVELYR